MAWLVVLVIIPWGVGLTFPLLILLRKGFKAAHNLLKTQPLVAGLPEVLR
jgi:hypothetical protein